MAWFKFDHETPEKVQVYQIAEKLGVPRTRVIGALVLVWRWFSEQTVQGQSRDCPPAIDGVGELDGLGGAMEMVGWLVREGGLMHVPHFDRWLGSAHEAPKKVRQRARRRVPGQSRDCPPDVPSQNQNHNQSQTPSSLRSEGAGPLARPAEPGVDPRPRKARREATGLQAQAIRLWERLYLEARGMEWVWDAKHAAHISGCRKRAGDDFGEIERRMRVLLFDPPSDWYAQNATPAILATHWNELAQRVVIDPVQKQKLVNEARIERLKNLAHANGNHPALHAPSDRPALLELDGGPGAALAREPG